MPVDKDSPLYLIRLELLREVGQRFRQNPQAFMERVRARELARRRSEGMVLVVIDPGVARDRRYERLIAALSNVPGFVPVTTH